jgi:hypothetical protein
MICIFAAKCDEYDSNVKLYHSAKDTKLTRYAVRGMEEIKKEIEETVGKAMHDLRRPAEGVIRDVALSTLAYFNAWLVRRGGWS